MLKVQKCWHHLLQAEVISLFVTRKCQKKKNRWKSINIDREIDREILYIFWTTWGIAIKFSGKMWLMIMLRVTKNQGFTLSLEDIQKTTEGVKFTPTPSPPQPFWD